MKSKKKNKFLMIIKGLKYGFFSNIPLVISSISWTLQIAGLNTGLIEQNILKYFIVCTISFFLSIFSFFYQGINEEKREDKLESIEKRLNLIENNTI